METPFDWITVAIFAGLIVLFLQRSSGEDEPKDKIWQYLIAAGGCALANYLGNEGLENSDSLYIALGVAVIAGTLGYVFYVLKPIDFSKRD